jgi:hypothetical protein
MFGAKPATTPTRKIIRPKMGPDGLFIQPREFGPDREQIENKLRMAAAEHFNYADPYVGNTRTFDEEGRYNCGRCNQVHGKQCVLVKLPPVDLEAGSCRKWENICAGDPEAFYRYGDAEEAVYGVAANGVGFGCKRCPFGSKAYQPDSRGRNMYCGKLWFRVFGNACCSLNGAKTKKLPDLPGYASGGRVSVPHALNAIHRAMAHMKAGNMAAAHQELLRSPDALAHPGVQKALPLLQQAQQMPPQQFAEGGEVDNPPPPQSSSPGTPGVSGAIQDAIHALKDYFIDTPRREVQAARQTHIDRAVEGDEPGYADGGKVSLMQNMLKLLVEHGGLSDADATKAMAHFRQQSGQVSPVARQMAEHMVQNVRPGQFQKSPAQLAKELRAGFVPPSDFSHLMYTDPTLTPLLNRYQGGVDNNNLTPQQKMALIQKLESLGGATPPPAAASPQQVDAILSQPPQ